MTRSGDPLICSEINEASFFNMINQYMKNYLICGILSLSVHGLEAQNLISSSGDHYATSSVYMSFSLGEPVTETVQNGAVQLTQGFHQSYIQPTVGLSESTGSSLIVYPNPTHHWVQIGSADGALLQSVQITSASGALVFSTDIMNTMISVDMSRFSKGTYFLRIQFPSGETQSSIIIKQ